MANDRWQRVADVYDAAQTREPDERLPFVREASAGDSDLRRQVESLLAEDDQSGVLDTPIQIAVGEVLNDNAAVEPGTVIGPYRIDTLLGVGGMGEVYRARDTKLNRDVAIKILPAAFASDPDRLARFRREAQVLASLNHPNIAAIYGLEGRDGQDGREGPPCLVLELVEGPTLTDRIARGRLEIEEALALARQIADALEAAHEQGIIHRDLKPANIKVREDGTVKVLDFGLAKLADPAGSAVQGGPSMTQSPTITTPAMTAAGMILGTAAYMSPEQAKGKPADKRSDIWAFGCVLFEMLTGKRTFDGEDVTETLAAILRAEPNWTALPVETPPAIKRLLTRCLQKDRAVRLQHIGDARIELLEAGREHEHPPMTVASPRRPSVVYWLIVAGAAIAGLLTGAGAGWRWVSGRVPAPEVMRLEIGTPPSPEPISFAVSPDGQKIVYVAQSQGGRQLLIRRLDETSARLLPGTEGAQFPFWSPDSRSIGFFAANRLQRIDVDGGPPRPLANVLTPGGGTWNVANTILYVPNTAGGAFTIAADGSGQAKPNADVDRRTRGHRYPYFLPDGRHFLVHAGAGETRGLYIGELGKTELRFLLNADTAAIYTSGRVLFARGSTLLAQPFDPVTLVVSGTAMKITDDIAVGTSAGLAASASVSGLVAYRTGASQGNRHFVWFDRSGHELGPFKSERKLPSNPSLTTDERFLAVQDAGGGGQQSADIYVIDIAKHIDTRITDDPAIDASPVWSPDGTRIVFNSTRAQGGSAVGTRSDLYVKSINSAASEQLILASDDSKFPCDWSPDGKFILYRSVDPTTGTYDLMAVAVDGPRTPISIVQTPADERDGQFSPDGGAIAYHSDKTGRPEIYVQAFPKATRLPTRVSVAGGTQPRWRRDGKELFYLGGDNQMMVVAVSTGSDGQPTFGTPVPLFPTRAVGVAGVLRQQYVVSGDGQRFLINVTSDEASTSPITVLLNWTGALKSQ